jgi:phosphatidylinositol-3-phosphatase
VIAFVRAAVVAAVLVLCVGAEAAPRPVPAFGHVVVVVFENKARHAVLGNRAAPAFNAFARRGAVLSGYRGVAHPSLPNYLALVSGSTHGITSDCTRCVVNAPNLAGALEAKGLTWKAYAEGLPRPGWDGSSAGRYAKKHVPFLYFRDVLASSRLRRNVVPLAQLSPRRLPAFALVTPNLCHDMHDCPVSAGDAWLRDFLPPLLRVPRTVVFVVFDEAYAAGNGVPALALGPLVRPGSHFRPAMTHYSLLRTIEDGLGLPRLGRSAHVGPVTGIWKQGTAAAH